MNTDASKHHVPRTSLSGYMGNFISKTSKYQIIDFPHSFQKPGIIQVPEKVLRHQDIMQRVHHGPCDDRFINPGDGKVVELVVQCTDRVYKGPRNSTYKRTFIRNVAPKTLRIANWPMNHLDYNLSDRKAWSYFLMVVKWPITCIILYHIVSQTPSSKIIVRLRTS
jgi:hypothetical protein